jgi:hypothetical protein
VFLPIGLGQEFGNCDNKFGEGVGVPIHC